MIAELLVQRDLPPNIVTGLKTISRLLNPNPTAPTVHELLANLSSVSDTPFISGEQISLTPVRVFDQKPKSCCFWSDNLFYALFRNPLMLDVSLWSHGRR